MKKTFRRILTLLIVFMTQLALAQEKTVTGTVSDESGVPLPGANVIIQGTSTGTTTDFDGNYAIQVNQGQTLEFSYVGYATQAIPVGSNNAINVSLAPDNQLEEVIVTAVGIKRKPDEITTAYESLKSDEITAANNPDAVQALAGKVSGLQINTTGAGVTPNTQILLRGTKSLTGDNEALIVIDNVISTATVFANLDPEVIESVNVLKGPNGAALYGSRGGNGVIIVNTKKGNNARGKVTVGITSSVTFEDIAFLPELQDRYGKGYWGEIDAFDQGSWGPEYDGSTQPVGLPFPTFNDFRTYTYEFIEDNIDPFFNTGITTQNTITVSGGDNEGYFTLSGNKRDTEGVLPGDKYVKDFFTLNGGKTFGKLAVSGIARFTKEKQNTVSAYDNDSDQVDERNVYQQLLQVPSDIVIEDFSSGDNGDHWTAFGDSPYWVLNNSRFNLRRTITDLSGEISYQFSDNISSVLRGNVVNSDSDFIDYLNAYTAPFTITGDGRNIQSNLEIQTARSERYYIDLINNFNYTLTDNIELKSLIGFNFTEARSFVQNTFGSQLTVPGLYVSSNISSGINIQDRRTAQRSNSIFANVDLSYKDFLFLNLTARNEWNSLLQSSSTGSTGDIGIFYPSAGVSFIPTKAFPEMKGKFLHKAKLSGSYVQVGNLGALDPHDLFDVGIQANGFPYSITGLNSFVAPATTSSATLEPEFVTTIEANLNLELLNLNGYPRITLDGSASFYTNDNQILGTSVSSSTGVNTAILNVGETETKAFEVDLGLTPLRNENFNWNINLGYSTAQTTVNKVTDQSSSLLTRGGVPGIYAIEGQEFPLIQGTFYERDDQGRVVLDADGSPRVGSGIKVLGQVNPDYILNFATQFSYKGFTFSATADYRTGHSFYSNIYNNLTGQGRSFVTAENGRGHFIFPNSTVAGSGVTNTTLLTGPSYGGPSEYAEYQSFIQSPDFLGVDENFIVDATAFKLREVSIGYSIPSKFLDKTVFQAISFGISGRNLLIVLPKENRGYNDPEFGTGIGNFGATPPTRFYAMNVNLTF
ncbi:SusC/RagA family TonB-linked outer membrane protein [Sungkyunkwania multivorans]|uniref:SusC/RagA family TonB-linked outer membrane protein n=1 Tax=Sungkyunkwania multivorans TaxID=1173618 RepID=A0ABW3CSQ3_9FLAO